MVDEAFEFLHFVGAGKKNKPHPKWDCLSLKIFAELHGPRCLTVGTASEVVQHAHISESIWPHAGWKARRTKGNFDVIDYL